MFWMRVTCLNDGHSVGTDYTSWLARFAEISERLNPTKINFLITRQPSLVSRNPCFAMPGSCIPNRASWLPAGSFHVIPGKKISANWHCPANHDNRAGNFPRNDVHRVSPANQISKTAAGNTLLMRGSCDTDHELCQLASGWLASCNTEKKINLGKSSQYGLGNRPLKTTE